MMRLGIVCRMDSTGLGHQTRALTVMLKPAKLMIIDSTPFNNNVQHPDWYAAYAESVTTNGFPTTAECAEFLEGLTHVITCETPYNYELFSIAQQRKIRSYEIFNYEFLDHLANGRLPQPDYFISPSHWHLQELAAKLPGRLTYLPQPVDHTLFNAAREANFTRTGKRRLLHVVGNPAAHDRNGTKLIVDALAHAKGDFQLVIKSQKPLDFKVDDQRVLLDYNSPTDHADLYEDFDALIMPRRYGGLCLPMQEALMSGLPVVMTDVEPNCTVLPKEWLVRAHKDGSFRTRTEIDLFSCASQDLGAAIDKIAAADDRQMQAWKGTAFALGYETYSMNALKARYREVFNA